MIVRGQQDSLDSDGTCFYWLLGSPPPQIPGCTDVKKSMLTCASLVDKALINGKRISKEDEKKKTGDYYKNNRVKDGSKINNVGKGRYQITQRSPSPGHIGLNVQSICSATAGWEREKGRNNMVDSVHSLCSTSFIYIRCAAL